jgi:hypothetical protein
MGKQLHRSFIAPISTNKVFNEIRNLGAGRQSDSAHALGYETGYVVKVAWHRMVSCCFDVVWLFVCNHFRLESQKSCLSLFTLISINPLTIGAKVRANGWLLIRGCCTGLLDILMHNSTRMCISGVLLLILMLMWCVRVTYFTLASTPPRILKECSLGSSKPCFSS